MTAGVSSPSVSGEESLALGIWHRVAEVIDVTTYTAAYRWNRQGAADAIRFDYQPAGTSPERWLKHSIAPLVRSFLEEVAADGMVTILDWGDINMPLDPASLTRWKLLVQDVWNRHRIPLLLLSGCGHVDATAEVTSPVQPHGDLGLWFRYRRRAWLAPRWDRRTNAIVFRGSTTGSPHQPLDERVVLALPRTRALSALHESALPADVAFSNVCQTAPDAEQAVEALLIGRGLVAEEKSMQDMMGYRYQLMIDGNHGSWAGHVWKLLSGSTNLWIASEAWNWYDELFEPWTHYVPVRADGSDLIDRYRDCLDDPSRARRIAKACHTRARQVFRRRYMLRTQRLQWSAAWRSSLDSAA